MPFTGTVHSGSPKCQISVCLILSQSWTFVYSVRKEHLLGPRVTLDKCLPSSGLFLLTGTACRGLGARRSLFLQPSGPLRPPCRHPDRPWEVDPHWPHTLGETEGIPQTHALSSPERPQALRVCVTFSVSRGGELVRLLPGFGDLGAGRPVAVSSRIKETRNVAAKSSGELQAPETGVVWPMPGGLGESPSGESQMLDSKADFVPPSMEI